jgi:hypothetical protein
MAMEDSRQRNMRAIENILNEEWNRGYQSAQEEKECYRAELEHELKEAQRRLKEYEKNGYTIRSHKTSAEIALRIANIRLAKHGLDPINSRSYRHEPEYGGLVEAQLEMPLSISTIGDQLQQEDKAYGK